MNDQSKPACQACGCRAFEHVLDAHDFDTASQPFALSRCLGCGLIRTEPVLSDEALGTYYDPGYYGEASAKFNPALERAVGWLQRRRARRILARLDDRASRRARVLDIGCGRGNMLRSFLAADCECHGVERTDFDRSGLPEGIELHLGPLQSAGYAPESFDIVLLWHSLEHLTEPLATLHAAIDLIRPGGLLVLALPNVESWQARVFGPAWFHLDLPRHTHHFGRRWMIHRLLGLDCRVEMSSTWSADQAVFGFIQSALNWLAPGSQPNALYAQLKGGQRRGRILARLGWVLGGTMLMPAALVEFVAAGLAGRGAAMEIHALKSAHPHNRGQTQEAR